MVFFEQIIQIELQKTHAAILETSHFEKNVTQ
jgi:hypothetical protein